MLATEAFRIQGNRVRRYPVIFVAVVIIAITILLFGHSHDEGHGHANLIQAAGYLFAMWLCAWLVDMYACWKPAGFDLPVRNPGKEFMITAAFTLLGLVSLCARFMVHDWAHLTGILKMLIASGIILFMYPDALAATMLIRRYKLPDLGFRVNGFAPAIVVLAITAGTSFLVSPHAFTWQQILAECGGNIGMVLFTGFIIAALPEEFLRMMLQTRIGAVANNKAIGWLLASLIWGLMHVPNWYGHDKRVGEVILSGIRIVPLGLMWGYLTHHTKSILPSILVHANNFWGLQNF